MKAQTIALAGVALVAVVLASRSATLDLLISERFLPRQSRSRPAQ